MPVNEEVDETTHEILEDAFEDYDRESVVADIEEWMTRAPSPTADSVESAAFELYRDEQGQWRWRLVSDDGQILTDSGTNYNDKDAAQAAVTAFKEAIGAAPVVAAESR